MDGQEGPQSWGRRDVPRLKGLFRVETVSGDYLFSLVVKFLDMCETRSVA